MKAEILKTKNKTASFKTKSLKIGSRDILKPRSKPQELSWELQAWFKAQPKGPESGLEATSSQINKIAALAPAG